MADPKTQSILLHSTGYIFLGDSATLGDDDIFEPLDMTFTVGFEKIDAAIKSGTYVIPTGQPMRVALSSAGMNPQLLARLTGGTVSAGCTRPKIETITKSTNTVTLTETPADSNVIRVTPVAVNVAPLKQVTSAPEVGEFSISGVTVTLNASQTQTDFECVYLYADGTNGDTLQIDPGDLPSTFSVFAIQPAEDIFPGTAGYLTIECGKVRRDSAFEFGGGKNAAKPLELEFSVVNVSAGDVKLHFIAE